MASGLPANTSPLRIDLSGKLSFAEVGHLKQTLVEAFSQRLDVEIHDTGITAIDITCLQLLLSLETDGEAKRGGWSLCLPDTSVILKDAERAGLRERFAQLPLVQR